MRLSKRLDAIANFVPEKANLADVCCDHAWIPIKLLVENRITSAIACDLREKPLQYAVCYADKWNISKNKIDFRQGDGLSPLLPNEADVLIVSGIGGVLMSQLLAAHPDIVGTMKKLILSPNRAPREVRQWVQVSGYTITDEKVVKEHNHFYEIIVVNPSIKTMYSEVELYFGPKLLLDVSETTNQYYEMRRLKDMALLARWNMLDNKQPDIQAKIEKLVALWDQWEEIRCRFK